MDHNMRQPNKFELDRRNRLRATLLSIMEDMEMPITPYGIGGCDLAAYVNEKLQTFIIQLKEHIHLSQLEQQLEVYGVLRMNLDG